MNPISLQCSSESILPIDFHECYHTDSYVLKIHKDMHQDGQNCRLCRFPWPNANVGNVVRISFLPPESATALSNSYFPTIRYIYSPDFKEFNVSRRSSEQTWKNFRNRMLGWFWDRWGKRPCKLAQSLSNSYFPTTRYIYPPDFKEFNVAHRSSEKTWKNFRNRY